jgi:hypothetical protein
MDTWTLSTDRSEQILWHFLAPLLEIAGHRGLGDMLFATALEEVAR